MTTALDFCRMGVVFYHDKGQPSVICPKELREDLMEEISYRAELITAKMPKSGYVPLIQIAEGTAKRWGECMSCLEDLPPIVSDVRRMPKAAPQKNLGGMCPLCTAALRKALRERRPQ